LLYCSFFGGELADIARALWAAGAGVLCRPPVQLWPFPPLFVLEIAAHVGSGPPGHVAGMIGNPVELPELHRDNSPILMISKKITGMASSHV
jgi:hypothetical protein